MYVRARPAVDENLISDFLNNRYSSKPINEEFLFFNRGSAALTFFLSNLSKERLRVGVQVFTCVTVLDAIKNANSEAVFLDTNKEYFTTLIDDLIGFEHLDVLILSHLVGIPNPDYLKIKKWAKSNNIIVIDDLCQTYKAMINGKCIEELSEYYFYSFYFDKPVTAMKGGMLKVTNADTFNLREKYNNLPQESEKTGKVLLNRLLYYYKLTNHELFRKEFRTNSFFEKLIIDLWSPKWNIKILLFFLSSLFNKIFLKFENKLRLSNKSVERMSNIQMQYIIEVLGRFKNNNEILRVALKKCGSHTNLDSNISLSIGARYSILTDRKSELIDYLLDNNIEASVTNWPFLIDDLGRYPQAEEILTKIVNIPVWSIEMWEKCK